jgi:nucleolar protein 4
MLKRLASHAVKAFELEVRQDSRQPLTADELSRAEELSGVVEDGDVVEMDKQKKDKNKSKFKGRDTGVKQAKIVRQAERVDTLIGKGRSKGYGFIEMHKHADALRLLRWANNNPEVGTLFDVWWKDELENLFKLEKSKPESERDDTRMKRLKAEIDKGDDGKKKSKGSLIVEFSIENIQVTKRRNASQAAAVSTKFLFVRGPLLTFFEQADSNSKTLERKQDP